MVSTILRKQAENCLGTGLSWGRGGHNTWRPPYIITSRSIAELSFACFSDSLISTISQFHLELFNRIYHHCSSFVRPPVPLPDKNHFSINMDSQTSDNGQCQGNESLHHRNDEIEEFESEIVDFQNS
jgi:hypothetical protein